MTPLDLAGEYTFDLYSDAEFVARCADSAKEALRHGNADQARAELAQAAEHADRVGMRFRDAERAIERAAS